MAARASPAIEVIVASDSTIWLRPRGNWQQWVLPADQRESFARVEDSRRGENGKEISPVKAKSQSPDLGAPQAGGIPASFGSDEAQSFQNVDQGPGNLSNGEPSGPRPVAFSVDTNTRPPRSSESAQLSATVPEFSPMSFQSPQHAVHPDIEPEAFESSEVPNLYIITRSTLQPVTSPKAMSTSAGDVASTDGSEKAQGPDKSANTTVPDSDQPVLAPLESEDK